MYIIWKLLINNLSRTILYSRYTEEKLSSTKQALHRKFNI